MFKSIVLIMFCVLLTLETLKGIFFGAMIQIKNRFIIYLILVNPETGLVPALWMPKVI